MPERGVATFPLQQLRVRAALDDPALVEHQNLVGGLDGLQPVRDDDQGLVVRQLTQRLLD